jgi:hypothetical protein
VFGDQTISNRLPAFCAPYTFLFLSFHYLNSGHYKNETYMKNVVLYLNRSVIKNKSKVFLALEVNLWQ